MTVVDDYLMKLDKPSRLQLEKVRETIKSAVSDLEEAYVYGVPGFKYKGKFFMGFAANKSFLSLYPGSTPINLLQDKLSDFEQSKGAIRFTADKPIPIQTLKEIIKIRFDEVAGKAKAH